MKAAAQEFAQAEKGLFQRVLVFLMDAAQEDLGIECATCPALDNLIVVFMRVDCRSCHVVDVDAVTGSDQCIVELYVIEGDGALTLVAYALPTGAVHCTEQDVCRAWVVHFDEAAQRTCQRCAGDERYTILTAQDVDVSIVPLLPALSFADEQRRRKMQSASHGNASQYLRRIHVRIHALSPPFSALPAVFLAKRKNVCQYA